MKQHKSENRNKKAALTRGKEVAQRKRKAYKGFLRAIRKYYIPYISRFGTPGELNRVSMSGFNKLLSPYVKD